MENSTARVNFSSIIGACIVAAALLASSLIVAHRPAPAVHVFVFQGASYTLTDIHVTRVTYSAKDDTFTVLFDWVWQPDMPASGPRSDSATLSNDGYGHYYGAAVLSPVAGGTGQNADVTIK